MTKKVNLFIVGAMKSGTTSLHEYLSEHPRIFMSKEKEPGYFIEQIYQSRELSWYESLFADANGDELYIGESSTHYTKLPIYPGVAERIYEYNPEAKIIYIMRDPFDRLISHYWHEVRARHHGGEALGLKQAVTTKEKYKAFSNYAMQLKPYLTLFGKENVYTLTFEELVRKPDETVSSVFRWLGLEELPTFQSIGEKHNAKPDDIVGVAGWGVLNKIERSKWWSYLSPLISGRLKNTAKKIAYKRIDESQEESSKLELFAEIESEISEQILELEAMLNRKFPEWRSYKR